MNEEPATTVEDDQRGVGRPPSHHDAPSKGAVMPRSRQRKRVAPVLAAGVALMIAVLFVLLLGAEPQTDASAESPLIGNLAPDAVGATADGQPFLLSRRKGSWVVLNFFTHSCVPCIREHPQLVRFVAQQRSLGTNGAEFYTIVRDSTREEVEKFFARYGGEWPIIYDPDFEFSNGFGVAQVPETWVIDDNGFVRLRVIGEVTADGLGALIARMRTA